MDCFRHLCPFEKTTSLCAIIEVTQTRKAPFQYLDAKIVVWLFLSKDYSVKNFYSGFEDSSFHKELFRRMKKKQ